MSLEKMGQAAREAAYQLATVSTAQKNRALAAIADELEARSAQILAANEKDIAAGREAGLTEAMLDRLLLNPARLAGIVADVRKVDPAVNRWAKPVATVPEHPATPGGAPSPGR